MRDPDRIEYVINELRAAWRRYPEMSLCQLVTCAAAIRRPTDSPCPFVEDDLLAEGLLAMATFTPHAMVPSFPANQDFLVPRNSLFKLSSAL